MGGGKGSGIRGNGGMSSSGTMTGYSDWSSGSEEYGHQDSLSLEEDDLLEVEANGWMSSSKLRSCLMTGFGLGLKMNFD